MKFFLFVLWSQALLCTWVLSQPEENEDNQKSYQEVVRSVNKFTRKFYGQVAAAHSKDNVFFSPVSILAAFLILALGAKSETQRQILEGLSFDTSVIREEDIHKGFQHLLRVINRHQTSAILNTVNAGFVDKEFNLLQKFLNDIKKYKAEVIPTDFKKPEEAKNQINRYVERKTNGLIKNLLSSLDRDTLFTIINTIYFKGTWVDIFNKNFTKEEDFHVDDKTVVKVPMMTRVGEYPVAFLRDVGCTVVEVAYKGNVSAIFIIPDKGRMREVEKSFQKGSLRTWLKKLKPRRISLSIPRFSVAPTLNLVNELRPLGITAVFTNNADLSGIAGSRNLTVSQAVHKAALTVNEEGTESAAATAIVIVPLSLPQQIKANHPFMMTIKDKISGGILFTGRIIRPQK